MPFSTIQTRATGVRAYHNPVLQQLIAEGKKNTQKQIKPPLARYAG
jgi:hypothetical protein